MKLYKYFFLPLIFFALVGCSAQATEAPQPVEIDPTTIPTEVPAQEETSPTEVDAGVLLNDVQALVGVWRGRPAGGLLWIDTGLRTTFAQTMDDLTGDSIVPTMYQGSIRFEDSTLYFEDERCDAPGTYEVFQSDEGGLSFAILEDTCDERINNLVGQRVEPQVDIRWDPVERPSVQITAGQALVGIWRGSPAGGLLQIDADLQTTFAQTMDDLAGDSIVPTMYQGSIRFEGSTLYFEDERCDAPGTYEVYRSLGSEVHFDLLEDGCDERINNLVGQRVEPQVDIHWNLVQADIFSADAGLSLVETIELPFVPHDIDVAPDGSIYAVELGVPRVHRLDPQGALLASWGEAGDQPGQFAFAPPPDGPPLDGGFIVVGAGGNIYVSDSYNNRVQIFDSDGKFLTLWESYGPEGTPFNNLGPISADAQGGIHVADFSGLHQFDADGGYVASMFAAGEVAFDSQGNLFTTVAFENLAMKVPAGGGEALMWGGEGMADGQFVTPMWVVVGPDDRVYIADHSGRVQIFDADGNFLGSWAGPEGEETLAAPSSLSQDAEGHIFVAPKDRPVVYVLGS